MSSLLSRLGRWSFAHPAVVLALWLVALVTVGGLLATQPREISTGITLEDTAAQQVLDTVATRLPEAGGTQGSLVFVAPDHSRVTTPERLRAIGEAVDAAGATGHLVDREARLVEQREEVRREVTARVEAQFDQMAASGAPVPPDLAERKAEAVDDATTQALGRLDGLLRGTDPAGTPLTVGDRTWQTVEVSADGTMAMATLQFTAEISDLPDDALDDVLTAAGDAVAGTGLTVAPSASLTPEKAPVGGHEVVGLAVAAGVLLLALGSVVAAGLPILTALAGVFLGVGGAVAFSAHYSMTTSTPALGLMIGLAVGIDYALFVVHKHRSLILATGMPADEAIGRATGTAGSAVVFAGSTVVIALLGLLTLGIGFVDIMAITAASTVVLAVFISVTALPALLGYVGERVVGQRARARTRVAGDAGRTDAGGARGAAGWARLATRRPLVTVAVVTLGLLALALPATQLHLGMPSGAVAESGSGERTNHDEITRTMGEGVNAPLVVTLRPMAQELDQDLLEEWQADLAAVDGVTDVRLMGATPERDLAIFQVIPETGPTDVATERLVHRLRATQISHTWTGDPGVTGLTALNIDLSESLAAATPVYLAVVVGLSLVILLLLFRSVLVPVAATLGFLLTIGATLGLVVTVFGDDRFLWLVGVDRAGPILSFLPIMATGILYGLAMDYQVFLGTSVREDHTQGADAREAIVSGFRHAGRVVVAAAVIMVSVFGGFVLSDDTTVRQFGLALSAGILIDAFVVRMTLMPALLHLAGEHAWRLPRRLDRLLPRVEVEGTAGGQ